MFRFFYSIACESIHEILIIILLLILREFSILNLYKVPAGSGGRGLS